MAKDKRVTQPTVDRNYILQQEMADKEAHQRNLDDIDFIMSRPEGRRFIWSLMERTGIYVTSFTGNSETFFREGQRNIGLMYLAEINQACPEKYLQMINEHAKKEAQNYD